MTGRPEPYSAIVMAIIAAAFSTWALLTLPLQGAVILVVASVLGWSGWMTFSYARPVRSRKVIAIYLCAVGFQLIHMAEEYTGGFPHEIVELFDSPRDWPEREFPGLYTAAGHLVMSALLIYALVQEERTLRAEERGEQREEVRQPVT